MCLKLTQCLPACLADCFAASLVKGSRRGAQLLLFIGSGSGYVSCCPHTHNLHSGLPWSCLAVSPGSDLTLPFVKRLKCSFACCTPLEQPFFFSFIFIFPSPEIVMLNGFSVSVSSGCCCCRWAPLALTRGYFIIY